MPSHTNEKTFPMYGIPSNHSAVNNHIGAGDGNLMKRRASVNIILSPKGNSEAYNNMPPYYTLTYIMKL